MNLRDTIRRELEIAYDHGRVAGEGNWPGHERSQAIEIGQDRLEKAIHTAFQSPAVVEAASEPIAEMCQPVWDFREDNHGPLPWMPWDDTPVIEGKRKAKAVAEKQLHAAFIATGLLALHAGEAQGEQIH